MEDKKSDIREQIQKNYRKYQKELTTKIEEYKDTLKSRDEIYEESQILVEQLLDFKNEKEKDKIEIKMEAI